MKKNLYEIGEIPPLGYLPEKMYAWTLREERYGEPENAFKVEIVKVPEIKENEMLICIMTSGLNFNGIWAAKGFPKNLVHEHRRFGDHLLYHISGSEGAGIVYKIGSKVNRFKVGDSIIASGPQWDYDCPYVVDEGDPINSPSFRIWGYEANFGSFAQFAVVREEQCVFKPKHLTWEEAASIIATGTTSYRMLTSWDNNRVKPNDIVLVWGGAGGLGVMAIQLAKLFGGIPIAIISSEDKKAICHELGAEGCINRKEFDHWGILPNIEDQSNYKRFLINVSRFRKKIWRIIGEKRNPDIILEHPGEDTMPTSAFICAPKGMVVTCGGTSGYNASFDLRPLWYNQIRIQGSHAGTHNDGVRFNKLVMNKLIKPVLTKIYDWNELPFAHKCMAANEHPYGNSAILIGANKKGLGIDS